MSAARKRRTSRPSGSVALGPWRSGGGEEGHAYYCYCRPEVLKAKREEAERRGEAWTYDRACARLEASQVADLEATGAPRAIRFRVPEGAAGVGGPVRGPPPAHG